MKTLFLILILIAAQAWGQRIAPDRRPDAPLDPSQFGGGDRTVLLERLLTDEYRVNLSALKRAKFYLIKGEAELARREIKNLQRTLKGPSRLVLERYLAVADFMQGNWRDALAHLNTLELNNPPHFGKICSMKVILMIAAKETRDLDSTWTRCKNENYDEAIRSDMLWMNTLVRLATTPAPGVAEGIVRGYGFQTLNNVDLAKLIKLAIYLNQEGLLVNLIDELDASIFENEEVTSLLTHVLFRQGQLVRAWKFLQVAEPDANIENMLGNIWLLRGNEEIAYGHFKLALKQKINSHNAAERALPLAWNLKQWGEGAKLAEQMHVYGGTQAQQLTVSAAFLIQLEQWDGAKKKIELASRNLAAKSVAEVDQLSYLIGLYTKAPRSLEKFGLRSCDHGDVAACWILMSQLAAPGLEQRLVDTNITDPKDYNYRRLGTLDYHYEPLRDETYVNQADIDELDEGLIKLIKN